MCLHYVSPHLATRSPCVTSLRLRDSRFTKSGVRHSLRINGKDTTLSFRLYFVTDGLVCLHALTDAPTIRFAAVTTAEGRNTPLRCVNSKLRYAPFAVDTPPLRVSALSLRDSRSTKSGVRQCLRHRRACLSACAYRCPYVPLRLRSVAQG